MMAISCTDAADTLMAKLQILLNDQTKSSWQDVLATAIALRHATALVSEAAEMRRILDVEVISKAYMETGRPGSAVAVLVEALATLSELPCDSNAQLRPQASYELHVRHLLQRCYQACLAAPACCCPLHNMSQPEQTSHTSCDSTRTATAAAAAVVTSSLQHCCCLPQQQQQYIIGSIANGQRMQQLASSLNNNHQLALISADVAEQYMAAGRLSDSCKCYRTCMDACTAAAAAAAASASDSHAAAAAAAAGNIGSWLQQLLVCVVPVAVDAHLLQGDALGAGCCLAAYNTILLALGRSACGECAVCSEQLSGATAVTLLGCGHIFHRACCNEWFGHKLFEAGKFHPECPLCRQVDKAIQPSETALKALEEMQRYYSENNDAGGSSDDASTSSEVESDDNSSDASDYVEDMEQGTAAAAGHAVHLQQQGSVVVPGSSSSMAPDVHGVESSNPSTAEDFMEAGQSSLQSVGCEDVSGTMLDSESELEASVASSTAATVTESAAAAIAAAFAAPEDIANLV